MKKTLLLLLLITCVVIANSFAQVRKVPSEVTDALKAKYPNAQNVEWQDKLTYFEADFTQDGTEMSADFSNSGEWKETNKKISFDVLPAAVKDGFKKSKYADWTPGSVTLILKKDKDAQYKVYAEKSSVVQKRFLYFNEQGQLEKETPGI